jgi:NAD-dependent aldehyde dehydrogenases
MYSKFGQFIDGKWQESEKKETYEVINPATEEIIGNASKASSLDVEKALKSAEKGLKVWRNTAPWQRSYIIRKIADLMRKKSDVLAKWLTLEVGNL